MTQEKPNYSIEQIICLLEVNLTVHYSVIQNGKEDYSGSIYL